MKKFLVILKFAAHPDFCRFYEQMGTGRVSLPSSNPLPKRSFVILKMIVPELESPFLLEGFVASSPAETSSGAEMILDISKDHASKTLEISRILAKSDRYRHLVDSHPEVPAKTVMLDENDVIPEEADLDMSGDGISGLEMEISDDEIEVLENPKAVQRQPVRTPQSSDARYDKLGGDLMDLRMEDEPEDAPKKVDLSMATAFLSLDEDSPPPSPKKVSPAIRPGTDRTFAKVNKDAKAVPPQSMDHAAGDIHLKNLRLANEPDDAPKKVDLSMATAFMLMEDDNLSETGPENKQAPSPTPLEAKPKRLQSAEGAPVSAEPGMDDFAELDAGGDFSENQAPGGASFDELKEMVTRDELVFEPEPELDISPKKIPEKKDLSPEERQKAEPVGQFFMNLTKAMLRSGYYAPGHPGSDTAKAGLFEEFLSILSGQREIMITNHLSREGADLMITGILDEPISIRLLVGVGVAELFVPKLCEYCERKKLLSFALKRKIPRDHFYHFIDIMGDPKVDNQKDEAAGKYLTNAFIAHGITEISTVFADDMVKLETDLPWRVEMAIHRLAKDLKIMPMFKGVSIDAIKQMKLQTVQDIIRPLKHPTFLNDFLVNCYLIAEYVKTMAPEEIEEIVVEAFSIDLLLPTSRFTFQELDHLKHLKTEHPDNPIIDRRINGIKRILKLISRRVVSGNAPGTRTFLEQLYRNEILSFDDLPEDVQYMINTMKIAEDVRQNFGRYIKIMASMRNPLNAPIYLKCFRRAVPVMMEAGNWEELARITNALQKLSSRQPFASETFYSSLKATRSGIIDDYASSTIFKSLGVSERLPFYIFKDQPDKIIFAYEQGDESQRKLIDQILNVLGPVGVDIFAKMLAESTDREVRKFCYETMIRKGEHARRWAISVLKDPGHPWFIHRNALMVLGKVSNKPADFEAVRMFSVHANPKIREEVLNVAVALKPKDGESLVLGALQDADPKVRWRAMRSIAAFSPISNSAMERLLELVAKPLSKDKEADENHVSVIANIATAITAMPVIPLAAKVEAEFLTALESMTGGKHSIWDKVKRAVGNDQAIPVLKVAIPLLGRLGTQHSLGFLKKISRSYPDLTDSIKKAFDQIKSRK